MAGISRSERATADARLVAECRRLLEMGVYPSVNALRRCGGISRNGSTILAARRRAIEAGLIQMAIDRRRTHPPATPRARPPGKLVATRDPIGFIKPRIAMLLDPPPPRKERAITPCWREIVAYRVAWRNLRSWLANQLEAPCPT
jgi:hypothetical protein